MPYIVNTYNGQQIALVPDGTIDQTTDIKLIGRNYAGFGEILNENLVHLLESFAGATQPPKPVAGQVWFDSANKVLKFYDGSQYRIAGGAETGRTAPTGLAKGDFWWEEQGEQLYVFNGEDFILIGPESAGGEGVSQVGIRILKDTLGNDRTVIAFTVQDQVINLVSKDEFTIDSSINPITGFSAIKKGLNLASKITYPGMRYWGTAEDADNLGGIPASQYVLNSGLQQFSDVVSFLNDNGITLGAGGDLKLHITNGDEVNITNQVGNDIRFNVNTLGAGAVNVAKIENTAFLPAQDNSGSIGSLNIKWANGYFYDIALDNNGALSGNVNGNVTGNLTGNSTGTHFGNVQSTVGSSTFNDVTVSGTITGSLVGTSTTAELVKLDGGTGVAAVTTATANSLVGRDANGDITANIFSGTATNSNQLDNAGADITATANTIAKRDSDGDLVARKFEGTATAAQFADLAEMYASDEQYAPGTVLVFGGDAEVTKSTQFCDPKIAGVVSTEPAHLMNSTQEGVAVALRGRVPVMVEGPVKKGDVIVSSPTPGVATALDQYSSMPHAICIIGKSLEEDSSTETRLIEVVV
tara:strand:+ start:4500 stop:6251 length:1752 start_codon:yes stop_codon:yes gene_type:complete